MLVEPVEQVSVMDQRVNGLMLEIRVVLPLLHQVEAVEVVAAVEVEA